MRPGLIHFNKFQCNGAANPAARPADDGDFSGQAPVSTVNGHASEVHACTFEVQKALLAMTLDEIVTNCRW